MDLKQLRSFIAVANTLNFGRAARQLHLSQSALSIQLQNLEAHLDVSLLERNRRTVRLTAAGASVLADSEQLLQQILDIELRAARIGSGEVGHLRIGFVASATGQLIPAIVLAFRKLYPGVTLDLKNLPTVQQIDALKSGNIDVGFVRLPLSIDGLSIETIHREPFAVVVPKTRFSILRRRLDGKASITSLMLRAMLYFFSFFMRSRWASKRLSAFRSSGDPPNAVGRIEPQLLHVCMDLPTFQRPERWV